MMAVFAFESTYDYHAACHLATEHGVSVTITDPDVLSIYTSEFSCGIFISILDDAGIYYSVEHEM